MPSHEDYLDKLLREMESGRVPKPETPSEDILPEDALPEELLSADVLPEETLPEDILSDSILPEELLSGEIMPEDALSEENLPEDILPGEILPEDLLVEQSLPEELLSEDILSGEIMPEDTVFEEKLSEELLPDEILPEDIPVEQLLQEELSSADVLPEEILSDDTLPEELLSGEIIPEAVLSGENLSEDILPGENLPEDVLVEQLLQEELSSADVLPEETLPKDVLSDDTLPEELLSGETMPEGILSGENLYEDILPGEIMPEDVSVEQLLPEELASADMLPEEYLSEDVLPEEFLSGGALPEDILSEVALPENAFSDETILKDTLSDEMIPADVFPEEIEKEPLTELSSAPDLEAVTEMSEEEINRFLAAGAKESTTKQDAGERASDELTDEEDIDLLGMLEDIDSSDLMDIHDMLERADHNEPVNEEIETLISGETGVTEQEDEKSKRAREKKQQRQEKAAAKKAAKAAAKEAKAAAKGAKRGAKAAGVAGAAATVTEDSMTDQGMDSMLDTDLLDSIVFGADRAGQEEAAPVQEEAVQDQAAGAGAISEAESTNESDDDMDFDMSSLFGEVDDSSLGGDTSSGGAESAFPDFVDIDGNNVDTILPELENGEKKKKGLLARFFDMLTEEAEEEESESLRLSDENKDILNDLDNEKTVGKKKKKKVKKVAAKRGDEAAEGGKGKAKKAKKVKKPKPEKPKKEPAPEPLIPEKKLKAKKVIPILVMCASLGVLIIVGINASVDFTDKLSAKEAYYAGDYQTCYQNLFGKENLDETEQIMFGTSKSILYIRLWLREYEMFAEAGEEIEALDSLIQTVNNYPELYDYAVQWKAGDEVMAGYAVILNILSEKYGLTEAQAQEIAAIRSDFKYTETVVAIVQGKSYGSWNEPVSAQPNQTIEDGPLPDELPEEDELTDSRFIDSQ